MTKEPEKFTCLVVEDEALAIEMMEDYIGRRDDLVLLGVAIEVADVRIFLEMHAPCIIFLDLVIPPGESLGFHWGMLPSSSAIVVVSGIPLSEYRGPLPNGELFELRKPFSFESFDRCVDRVLNRRKLEKDAVDD
ncbi:response regulator [Olivibacter sp. XZL3]|uniref:response regulator n=1 Tax=Olivibacter sp. XZL3 TaxID=1735116 RepID=UPI001064FE65|nr:hypothetical protein [Olivibacter sp. XZL3]